MSIVCEKVPPSEIIKNSTYYGVESYVSVNRSERPKDIKVAEKWCMEPCFITSFYEEIAQRFEDFEVRPDDVWVVSFPKCGTTWTQEMVWQICNGIDYEGAMKELLGDRFPFLEFGCILARSWGTIDKITHADQMSSPRLIKSHMPAHLLPRQIWTVRPKLIYVARNAKDSAVSLYHHYRNLHRSECTFGNFMEAFLQGKTIYSPYHPHIIDFWRMRHEKNILFITYEDMKKDLPNIIEKTTEFLGKSLTKEQVQSLADHLSFSTFSKNTSVNMHEVFGHIDKVVGSSKPDDEYNFVRKGVAGGFKDDMTPELIKRFNKWSEDEAKKWNCDEELKEIFMFSKK